MSEDARDVFTTPLALLPTEYWVNSILLRLALAGGFIEKGQENYQLIADEVLTAAEDALFRLKGLDK